MDIPEPEQLASGTAFTGKQLRTFKKEVEDCSWAAQYPQKSQDRSYFSDESILLLYQAWRRRWGSDGVKKPSGQGLSITLRFWSTMATRALHRALALHPGP